MTEKDLVVVIGLGYVGLPLAILCSKSGYPTIGIDIDLKKVKNLEEGLFDSPDVDKRKLLDLIESGAISFTRDFEVVSRARTIIICVPTPLGDDALPDLAFLRDAAVSIAPFLQPGTLVISESTSYPGTLEQVLIPIIERARPDIYQHIQFAVAPERINPGSEVSVESIPRVVGAVNANSLSKASIFYRSLGIPVREVNSARVAELSKLIENTFRFVNISLINEIQEVCVRSGIDLREAIDAAATKPYGFLPFYPGPGIGGHCIPVDSQYLQYFAMQNNFPLSAVEVARSINSNMANLVLQRVSRLLDPKKLSDGKLLVVGVAYKSNVPDTRETPALSLIESLRDKGASVSWHDNLVLNWRDEESVALEKNYWSLSIVHTFHDALEIEVLKAQSEIIVDLTGRLRCDPSIVQL